VKAAQTSAIENPIIHALNKAIFLITLRMAFRSYGVLARCDRG
jgi:hypothetical protein